MVARNGALSAEQALAAINTAETTEKKEEQLETLTNMRDAFNALEDKILKGEEELKIGDFILLYAGANVSRSIIQKNINTWTAVVKEYDDNLIPKLYEVAKEADEGKRASLIDEYFNKI